MFNDKPIQLLFLQVLFDANKRISALVFNCIEAF